MRTTYIANTTEAANLHSGKQTAIVTLVKPQIKNTDFYFKEIFNEKGYWYAMFEAGPNDAKSPTSIPYQPGQTIAVREAYMDLADYYYLLPDCNRYGYKANVDEKQRKEIIFYSPITMPRAAVRTHLLVKDVVCIRVQDMTSEQAQAIWPDMSNIERMQDLHRRFGGNAWADNVFVFITKVEKV